QSPSSRRRNRRLSRQRTNRSPTRTNDPARRHYVCQNSDWGVPGLLPLPGRGVVLLARLQVRPAKVQILDFVGKIRRCRLQTTNRAYGGEQGFLPIQPATTREGKN